MDQVKQQLQVVLKYGFWIGCAVVLFGSLGIWFMTTSKLSQEASDQTGKIESDFGSVSTVRNALSSHPNPTSHAAMEVKIDDREDEVLQAWSSVYDRQRDILTWPVGELQQDLIDVLKDKIPIEAYYQFPIEPADELETSLLNNYQYYIGNALPAIAKIGKTEWTAVFDPAAGGGMSGGMDMGMGMEMDMGMGYGDSMGTAPRDDGPLVKWSGGSQNTLLSDLFPWRGKRPSTLDVYYSQENLWILKQLLQIVSNVNGEARQRFQAKIREINRLSIGKSVKFGAGSISQPGTTGGGMGMGDMYGDMGGMDDMYSDMGSGSMGMDGMDMGGMGMAVSLDPADSRYVDTQYQPITGSALRSALTSNSPTDANLAVAKRVPVMMSFTMDQRSIPALVAECGNVPLMVEVKQVRVLPKGTISSGGMDGGMGDMGGMGMESGMGMGMESGMGGMGDMGGMGMATISQPKEEFPLDMTVEIYGLIYIYNPPQKEKLGVEQVNADTVIDGESMREGAENVPPVAAPAAADEALPPPTAAPADASPVQPGTPAAPAATAPGAPVATPPATGVPAPPTALSAPAAAN